MDITYKPFKVSTLFDVTLSKGDIKLGKMEQGDIPLISSDRKYNGVVGYISTEGDGIAETFDGNCITVDMFGNAFYQPITFYSVSHGRVNILLPKFDLTRNIALFICACIMKEQYKHDYGRAVYSNVVADMDIYLPVDDKGNPDWNWIEQYMASLEADLDTQVEDIMEIADGDKDVIKTFADKIEISDFKAWLNDNANMDADKQMSLDSTDWSYFKVGDLFNIPYKGKAYTKSQLSDLSEGNILVNYVTRTANNNGVSAILNISDTVEGIEKGNALVIGDTTATITYQSNCFICGDHIVVLRADWLNKYTGTFIKAILETEKYKYSYGRAFKIDFIVNADIPLPINKDGMPNWDWIEQYMKSLPYSDKEQIGV